MLSRLWRRSVQRRVEKYPSRWNIYSYLKERVKCIGINIVTQEIKLRNDETGEIFKISLEERTSNRQ